MQVDFSFRLSAGPIDRYKACLVAKGFHQRPRVDYHDIFSPVIKPTIVCLVLNLAVSRSWSLHQPDVNNLFLQGHLFEDVYMAQTSGFIDLDFSSHICKLCKVIYGLKQVPRVWYHKLKQFLVVFGFVNSHVDTSLFILNTGDHLIFLFIYVDDLIIIGNDSSAVQWFVKLLA